MKEGVDFRFLDDAVADPTTPVEILTGRFKSVRVCYGQVRINEQAEDGSGLLQFVYKVIEPTETKQILRLKANRDFNNLLGDILRSIILESIEENDITEDYIEEPSVQRGVL